MNAATYTRYEVVRAFRNRRFFIFSIGFPLVLYFVIAAPNRDAHDFGGSGLDAPLYLMVGLTAFGTMNAVLGVGARIAAERSTGWNRQLRLTPLTSASYFRTKVLTAYLMAMVSIVVLYAAGALLGVRMPAGRWIEMTVLMLVGLMPFAALGIADRAPDRGSSRSGRRWAASPRCFGLLGGVWFPIGSSGFMHDLAVLCRRTGWSRRATSDRRRRLGLEGMAGRGGLDGAWSPRPRWAYRRDTGRY